MYVIFVFLFFCFHLVSPSTTPDYSGFCNFVASTNIQSIHSEWSCMPDGSTTTTIPCSWAGVTCDGSHNVIGIVLRSQGISGTLPSGLYKFALLTNLQLDINKLTGKLPQTIGSLSQLLHLDVNTNKLTGSIPLQICCASFESNSVYLSSGTEQHFNNKMVTMLCGTVQRCVLVTIDSIHHSSCSQQ